MRSATCDECIILFSLPIVATFLLLLISLDIIRQFPVFILSTIIASLINILWWKGFAGSKYDMKLAALEHYHHAIWLSTLALIFSGSNTIASVFLCGCALIFWLDEFRQEHKFAIGSNHKQESDRIGYALVALWFIALVGKIILSL